MKFLCLAVLAIACLQVNGLFFGSKKKDRCPKYEVFQNKAITCMLQHEGAFESKEVPVRCKAYRESSGCMRELQKQMRQCELMPPVDVYNSIEAWQQLQKSDLCFRSGN